VKKRTSYGQRRGDWKRIHGGGVERRELDGREGGGSPYTGMWGGCAGNTSTNSMRQGCNHEKLKTRNRGQLKVCPWQRKGGVSRDTIVHIVKLVDQKKSKQERGGAIEEEGSEEVADLWPVDRVCSILRSARQRGGGDSNPHCGRKANKNQVGGGERK